MFIEALIGLVSGFLGAIGVGGGAVLMLYLCTFAGFTVTSARSINLLFFIPCAGVGLIFHAKNQLIEWKWILKLVIFSILGVVLGFIINQYIPVTVLKKVFGVFILLLGLLQLKSVLKKDSKMQDHFKIKANKKKSD